MTAHLTPGGAAFSRHGRVHALIDGLPPEIRDPALTAIFSALFAAQRD